MGADDDRLLALAGNLGDHVAVAEARDEAAADDQPGAHPVAQPLGVGRRDERGRRGGHVARRHERDRADAEGAPPQPPLLADGEDPVREPPHLSLHLAGVRVHAGAGLPALAVHLEQRLLGLVAEQRKLLEARLEPERGEGVRDRVRGTLGLGRPAAPDADLDRERAKQLHDIESMTIRLRAMKVGIVVPFSWSFWGAVIEHAELQAAALRSLGVETQDDDRQRPARPVHARRSTRGSAATTTRRRT